ncbi:MAG TPA: hypothetical protein VNV16_12470 [Methylibium sp.]|nr:hypothetical protein [Methylibium sp.]
MLSTSLYSPAEPPPFLRATRAVGLINPESPPRRVRAGAAVPGEPRSDDDHDRLLRDSDFLREARHTSELKLAYRRGLADGHKRGRATAQRRCWMSGFALGLCAGSAMVFGMLWLGISQ